MKRYVRYSFLFLIAVCPLHESGMSARLFFLIAVSSLRGVFAEIPCYFCVCVYKIFLAISRFIFKLSIHYLYELLQGYLQGIYGYR